MNTSNTHNERIAKVEKKGRTKEEKENRGAGEQMNRRTDEQRKGELGVLMR